MTLAFSLRSTLTTAPDVSRLTSLRRSTILFSQGQQADSAYLIEDGLIKLTRSNKDAGRLILSICGPGHLVGEELISEGAHTYHSEAEVLCPTTLYKIPRDTLRRSMNSPELAGALMGYLLESKFVMAHKVELLCLHDVEYRIKYYLAELSKLVKPSESGEGYQVPITQLELAHLIGATRETTSTTLNQLERKGLVKLARRLLTVNSPSTLTGAAHSKNAHATSTAGSV